MVNLNKYQKIQIVLLVLIVIAGVAFARAVVKNKNTQNFGAKETSVGAIESIEEEEKEEKGEIVVPEEEDIEENPEDTSWDEEDAEDTKVDMEEEKKEENNKAVYYIKVNYTANCVTVYKKDDSGNYTIPVKALICSTGTATPTSGVYKTSNKYRWHQLNGGVYGQYCTRITGHILFHSVPCSSNTPDSLKYTAYDKLGTRASAGCVRLTVEGAMWIYNNCASGTYVEFYSSSNPGPLGKPSARKISSNLQCRNWDPTDPDPRNPWRTYVEPAVTEPVKQEQPAVTPEVKEKQPEPQVQPEPPKQEEPKQENDNTSSEQPKTEEPKQDENTNSNTNSNTNTGNTGGGSSQDTSNDDTTSGETTQQEEEGENE